MKLGSLVNDLTKFGDPLGHIRAWEEVPYLLENGIRLAFDFFVCSGFFLV